VQDKHSGSIALAAGNKPTTSNADMIRMWLKEPWNAAPLEIVNGSGDASGLVPCKQRPK